MPDHSNKYIISDVLVGLKNLQDNFFHVAITSPPYNKMEKNNGGLVSSVKYAEHKDSMNEDEYQKWQIVVLNEVYEKLVPGGSFFYNHKVRYLNGSGIHPITWISKTKFVFRQEIIWDRNLAGNIRGWRFWQVDERVYWLYKPDNRKIGKEISSKDAKMTSIWRMLPEADNPHPAPFPIELPARIIITMQNIFQKKDIEVLDPFAGSGTTGIAASILKANSTMIEISKEYKEMYEKRLLIDGEKNIKKINKEILLHVVEKTYEKRKNEKKQQMILPILNK